MREQILQMICENQRTVKELSDALGLSKDEILANLSGLPVRQVRTVMHNGRSRPVIVFYWMPS
jgi:DNA-directed RNA polymerase specialized sigma24 family protein